MRLRALLLLLFALVSSPGYAQSIIGSGVFGDAKTGGAACGGYVGPGDLPVTGTGMNAISWMWAEYSAARAVTAASCGNKILNVCVTSGSTVCADILTSTVTGKFVYQTINGTVCPSLTIGACQVHTAYDLTGAGNCTGSCDAIQTTGANQPSYLDNCTQNGEPCIYSTGASQKLETAGNTTLGSGGSSIYSMAVVGYNATPTATGGLGLFVVIPTTGPYLGGASQGPRIDAQCGSSAGNTNPGTTFNYALVECFSTSELYVNTASAASVGALAAQTGVLDVMWSNNDTILASEIVVYNYAVVGNGDQTAFYNNTSAFYFDSTCAQATAFLARTSGETANYNRVLSNTVCGIVADGNWSLMDAFYFFPAANSTDALLNLVSTSYTGVVNGSCTFTANVGYTGDASSCYIHPSFDPSTAGGNYTTSQASLGAYVLSNRTTTQSWVEVATSGFGSLGSYIAPYQSTGNDLTDVNVATGYNGTSTTAQGQYVSTLNGTSLALYKNSSATPTGTNTQTPVTTGTSMDILGFSGSSNFSGDQESVVWWGGTVTSTQAASIMRRVNKGLCNLTSPINVYAC